MESKTMSALLVSVGCGVAGYLIGSIPFGWIIVKLVKGIDVRQFGSGRTGGTNVFRAAGVVPGLLTAILDVLKGVAAVLIVRQLVPNTAGWAEALTGFGVVLGHNASCFLNFRGGAGGATAVGTSIALWPWGGVPAFVVGSLMLFVGGYASIASMLAGLIVAVASTVGAALGAAHWSYAAYGWGVLGLILIALRPNIERLRAGTEKRVSWFKRPGPAQSGSPTAQQ
ncbi:MAG: glycerol-3-phosphate acyltransferase [Thermoflexales bacterium]|nr:glycerol-3-phosphate acyltransferase [Thermoflexales bacterium]MDW8350402.1 glycerol-3-phosphate acyltransferase [Anaerolineae bacterium]